ncbi:MAG: hypothetical protein AAFX78_01805 [Cyanobacteria bacterium J06638_20]
MQFLQSELYWRSLVSQGGLKDLAEHYLVQLPDARPEGRAAIWAKVNQIESILLERRETSTLTLSRAFVAELAAYRQGAA